MNHIDHIWSLDLLDLKGYDTEKKRSCRYVLVVIDNFSKFRRTAPLENDNAQTTKDSFEIVLITSKRKPKLIKRDDGKDFEDKICSDLFKKLIL